MPKKLGDDGPPQSGGEHANRNQYLKEPACGRTIVLKRMIPTEEAAIPRTRKTMQVVVCHVSSKVSTDVHSGCMSACLYLAIVMIVTFSSVGQASDDRFATINTLHTATIK